MLEQISRYGEAHKELFEFVAPPFLIRGGEICKHEPIEVEKIQSLVERHKICRHSFILAIGGGAVLDAAGYAAATSHRGVRLIRIPTTVLAQNDAGIGVKNGINAFGQQVFRVSPRLMRSSTIFPCSTVSTYGQYKRGGDGRSGQGRADSGS